MSEDYPKRKVAPKSLSSLLDGVEVLEIVGDQNVLVEGVEFQSDLIQRNFLFVAETKFPIYFEDGHDRITEAVEKGCNAVICEEVPSKRFSTLTYVTVASSHKALILILRSFYDDPSRKLKVVAVTGTNGKTSTVTLSHFVFRQLGIRVGLISTNCIRINDKQYKSVCTTPSVVDLNRIMYDMVSDGCEYCFMEASSHGLHQDRVGGIFMSGAVFTNISHDHLDYHKTFLAYFEAKKKLFDSLFSGTFALVNADDPNTLKIIKDTKANVYNYSTKAEEHFDAKILKNSGDGLELEMEGTWKKFNLIGEFNAYNILAAYGIGCCLGQDKSVVLDILCRAPPIKGRFQFVPNNLGLLVVIDYAHTPHALEEVLKTANSLRDRNAKMVCVVGCGGNRDVSKRPAMTKIAASSCDAVIVTSDNPRFESPQAILDDMMTGASSEEKARITEIIDRRQAIKQACEMVQPGDVVLIAGKGHESYQIIGDKSINFDDFEIAKEFTSGHKC